MKVGLKNLCKFHLQEVQNQGNNVLLQIVQKLGKRWTHFISRLSTKDILEFEHFKKILSNFGISFSDKDFQKIKNAFSVDLQ